MHLYGIPNCTTVKKARDWLASQALDYVWHDFKKAPPTTAELTRWVDALGWEVLVNKSGTTWRKLSDAEKAAVTDAASAIALMQAQPSVIKRPVLEYPGGVAVGFSAERYADYLA
ncbi:ArsC family reductase [Chitinibacteraceae bacterium HSL-7]